MCVNVCVLMCACVRRGLRRDAKVFFPTHHIEVEARACVEVCVQMQFVESGLCEEVCVQILSFLLT